MAQKCYLKSREVKSVSKVFPRVFLGSCMTESPMLWHQQPEQDWSLILARWPAIICRAWSAVWKKSWPKSRPKSKKKLKRMMCIRVQGQRLLSANEPAVVAPKVQDYVPAPASSSAFEEVVDFTDPAYVVLGLVISVGVMFHTNIAAQQSADCVLSMFLFLAHWPH